MLLILKNTFLSPFFNRLNLVEVKNRVYDSENIGKLILSKLEYLNDFSPVVLKKEINEIFDASIKPSFLFQITVFIIGHESTRALQDH